MKRLFNPKEQSAGERPARVRPYQTEAELELAVNVALVCDRPLLLMGASGTGKSTLARFVAWCLQRDYAEYVMTSRTTAEDLKWRFDAVRRLQAANRRDVTPLGGEFDRQFVTPGVLWDAFDPDGARAIRSSDGHRARRDHSEPSRDSFGNEGVVVLLDEIDKADPDVPNDLLVTLDQRGFHCSDLDEPVSAAPGRKILVMITSNQERELPRAFTRRCIVANLPRHEPKRRRDIAVLHHPKVNETVLTSLLHRIDKVFDRLEAHARTQSVPLPSTAEYLDAVNACLGLELETPSGGPPVDPARTAELEKALDAAIEATLWKYGPAPRVETKAAVEGG
jgi:MoxR-like ATPase